MASSDSSDTPWFSTGLLGFAGTFGASLFYLSACGLCRLWRHNPQALK